MVWDDAAVRRLRELWAAGYSGSEIGLLLDTSKGAVVGKAHRLELDARPSCIGSTGITISDDRVSEVRALQNAGKSDAFIARELRLNRRTVARIASYAGDIRTPQRIVRTPPPLDSEAVPVPRPVVPRQPPRPAPEPPWIDASRECQFMSGHRHHWVPCGKPAIGSWCPEHSRKVHAKRRDREEAA